MISARRAVALSVLVVAPFASGAAQQPPPPQLPQQSQQPRATAWSWFGGGTLAFRENTKFDPGFDVGVSVAVANPERAWSLRFDAEYAHAGFVGAADSSITPLPPAKDFDALSVQGTAIYDLWEPPYEGPQYRAALIPYVFVGGGAYLLPGSAQGASLGIHGGVGLWLHQPPLDAIELIGHDVVDPRASQYLALVLRLTM